MKQEIILLIDNVRYDIPPGNFTWSIAGTNRSASLVCERSEPDDATVNLRLRLIDVPRFARQMGEEHGKSA